MPTHSVPRFTSPSSTGRAVLEKADEVVHQPAYGHGHPHELDAEPGGQGHSQHHPQAQVHQIRHGKEGHVPAPRSTPSEIIFKPMST